jgi:hypothetical protein
MLQYNNLMLAYFGIKWGIIGQKSWQCKKHNGGILATA